MGTQTLFISPARLRIGDTIHGAVYWDEVHEEYRSLRAGGGTKQVTVQSLKLDPGACRGKVHVNDGGCYDIAATIKVTR